MSRRPAETDESEERPGVPLFRTWRSVYLLVIVVFVLCVLGLTLFSRHFA